MGMSVHFVAIQALSTTVPTAARRCEVMTVKLIDPNKLDGCKLYTTDQFPRDRRVEGWNDCIEYLQKCCVHVPVVEVVQCKDCVEYIPWLKGERVCGRIGSYFGNTKPNDFCSRGVRKMAAEVEG